MLELIKKQIHMNRLKGSAATQVTLDDDFIVPDAMEDMAQVVMSSGDITVESVKNQGERVLIKGKLQFQVLYRKEGGGLQTLAGTINFEEPVNMDGLDERDYLETSWEIEDLSADMINSRKLSVKAILTLQVRAEALGTAETAVDVAEEGGALAKKWTTADIAAMKVRRKDTYRVRETMTLPGSKPSMEQVLWTEMRLRNVFTKPMDGKVQLDGELAVFVIYSGEGEHGPMQWWEERLPFSGQVELPESVEGMIPAIRVRLVHKDAEAKPDYDGEMRDLEVDAVVELDMKLYEEEPLELLEDVYATDREVSPERGQVVFDRLLAKNTGKCKVSEKLNLGQNDRILQVCHQDAAVKIDEVEARDDALHIEGVLEVTLLYLTSDDMEPVKTVTEPVPFHFVAQAPGITEESTWQLDAVLEQLSTVMAGSDAVEVKAVLSLDTLVLQPVTQPVIQSISETPLDMEKLQAMPGIVGYIVQPGDRLWDVAKKFHTTVQSVMDANSLAEETVKAGDRLILVKEVAGV